MTLDQVLANAAAQIDEIFAESNANYEASLIRHGATDEELEREMAFAERTRVENRARALAELKALMIAEVLRGGATLQ